jgi:hypothetical protein
MFYMLPIRSRRLAAVAIAGLPWLGALAQCVPSWVQRGQMPDTNGAVQDILILPGSPQDELIAGGSFSIAGGSAARNVARHDDTGWHAMAEGLPFAVTSLEVHLGQIYAAGGACEDASNVAVFAGDHWTLLPKAPLRVAAMLSAANTLYIAGTACSTGPAVYRWDGAAWVGVGPDATNTASSLAWFQDSLYVAGNFVVPGNPSLNNLFRVSAGVGQAVGPGLNAAATITVNQGQLVAVGTFTPTSGQPGRNAAAWDGLNWSALPSIGTSSLDSVKYATSIAGSVYAIWTSNPMFGGTPTGRLIRLDASWTTLYTAPYLIATGVGSFDNQLVLSGALTYGGNTGYILDSGFYGIAGVAGGTLAPLFPKPETYSGRVIGLGNRVLGLNMRDYRQPGPAAGIIREFDGSSWPALPEAFDANIEAAVSFEGALFCSGAFTKIGAQPVTRVARLEGDVWSDAGAGLPFVPGQFAAIGQTLYCAGWNSGVNSIAEWNGSAWNVLPGLPSATFLDTEGSLALLLSSTSSSSAALWDGQTWTNLPIPTLPAMGGSAPAVIERGVLWNGACYISARSATTFPMATFKLVNGAWVQSVASDSVFLKHRGNLYRTSVNGVKTTQRLTPGGWIDDPIIPNWTGTPFSVNGDLWMTSEADITEGDVVSAGLIQSTCACKVDLTSDGVQDLDDYFAFFNAWDTNSTPADVNFDGTVDLIDFFYFFQYWDLGCGV